MKAAKATCHSCGRPWITPGERDPAAKRIEALEADLTQWVQQAEDNSGGWQRACLRIEALEAEREALEVERERLWCTACGTVTRDNICDCNRWHNEMSREPHFVNYADAMQEAAHGQAQRIEALEKALREARQYVSDAGGDEDSETQRHSASLLIVIDAALAPEMDK